MENKKDQLFNKVFATSGNKRIKKIKKRISKRTDGSCMKDLETKTITIRIAPKVSEADKNKMKRMNIRTVSIADMAKRREKNISTFREMGKPGYNSSCDFVHVMEKNSTV